MAKILRESYASVVRLLVIFHKPAMRRTTNYYRALHVAAEYLWDAST
jgi:hypothetical protein